MKINEMLRLIAGIFVLIALALGATVHPHWNYLAAFVAANLIQSAFTGWCPMMAFLRKLGVQE
jgi:membrane protein implicated in regulation of membrane protease activity